MYLPNVKTHPILAPISWLYGLGVWWRNKRFDSGSLKETSFEDKVAVISVGNLVVGGTGKTPHTEYIVRLLQRNGVGPIAVLSRGYKRLSRGFVMAGPDVSSSKLGDESYQIHHKFPNIIVAVCEKRVEGIKKLLALPEPPKVIILDDAMQHRYVKPGLSICLTSHNRILYKDKLIPYGLLREPMENVKRADLLVITKCPGGLRKEEEVDIIGKIPTNGQPILYSAYRYGRLINLDSGLPCDMDHATDVLVLTGIADPATLHNYVEKHYRLMDHMEFGDHHHFSAKDIKQIEKRLDGIHDMGFCSKGKQSIIITTEKDASRLVDHPAVSTELRKRIYFLPTEVYFLQDHAERIDKIILDYVNKER